MLDRVVSLPNELSGLNYKTEQPQPLLSESRYYTFINSILYMWIRYIFFLLEAVNKMKQNKLKVD